MLRGVIVGILILLWGGFGLARAQGSDRSDPPAVEPGAVVTIVIRTPATTGSDTASYRLRLDSDFRPFVPSEGKATRLGDFFLVPVTFTTPATLPAGLIEVGAITVQPHGGAPIEMPLAIRVLPHRELSLTTADLTSVAPGRTAWIGYTLRNIGNVPDTVRLSLTAPAGWQPAADQIVIVAAADSILGQIEATAPAGVEPGGRQVLRITARSRAGEQTEPARVVVAAREGWLGNYVHLPSRVFIGHSSNLPLAEPVVSIHSSGEIAPETTLGVDFRHGGDRVPDPVLQRQLSGPRLRLSLARPGLELDAGDIYAYPSIVAGAFRQGRGLRGVIGSANGIGARFLVATPGRSERGSGHGHMVHAEAGLDSELGRWSSLVVDIQQQEIGLGATRSTGAGVRWSGEDGPHRVSVETSWARFAAGDSIVRSGPAIDARYSGRTEWLNGRLRVRRVPGATMSGGAGNEISGSLSAEVLPEMRLLAWGYRTEQDALSAGRVSRATAGNIGLRTRVEGVELQVGGTLHERSSTSDMGGYRSRRRTVDARMVLPLRHWSFEASTELGRAAEAGVEGSYHAFGATARWQPGAQWLWASVRRTRRPAVGPSTNVQLGGTVEAGPAQLSTGVTLAMAEAVRTGSFWTVAEVAVGPELAAHIGASNYALGRPSAAGKGGEWTLSLGVSRRLEMPLPLPRRPELQGLLFEDMNANGLQDPGEPGVPGVEVRVGHLTSRTRADGTFQFPRTMNAPLKVSPGDLPLGLVVPPDADLPNRGTASIRLVRTAALRLRTFLDRDGDRTRDAAEVIGAGAVVTLVDANGRPHHETVGPDGSVTFSSLLPGRYSITARPTGAEPTEGKATILTEVDLAPGAELERTLAIPFRQRTIRIRP